MTAHAAARIVKTFTHRIRAEPGRIFPLLCPVREVEWIEGWSSDLVYSGSGVAEKHCVFETDFPHTGLMTWIVTRYEPARCRIEFAITRQGSHVEKLEIAGEDNGDGSSTLRWTRIYTSLSAQGKAFLEQHTGEPLDTRMEHLGRALDHYLQTGEMLGAQA